MSDLIDSICYGIESGEETSATDIGPGEPNRPLTSRTVPERGITFDQWLARSEEGGSYFLVAC